jgi:hypothetical protein
VDDKFKLQIGVNERVSNSQYHGDLQYLSSSNLKTLLKSPEQFYKERILGIRENKKIDAFDLGSYVHCAILEPHLLTEEFAIWSGWRKAGQEFEAFKEAAGGKTILSAPQKFKCDNYVKAFNRLGIAREMVSGGFPEHTVCTNILDVPIKSRFDYINVEKGYIFDVKTTSQPSGLDIFRRTVDEYGYGLSAALYCQAAYDTYGKIFDFYFGVISKSDEECHVYKASSDLLSRGTANVTKALVLYKKCMASGVWVLDQPSKRVIESVDYVIEEV